MFSTARVWELARRTTSSGPAGSSRENGNGRRAGRYAQPHRRPENRSALGIPYGNVGRSYRHPFDYRDSAALGGGQSNLTKLGNSVRNGSEGRLYPAG